MKTKKKVGRPKKKDKMVVYAFTVLESEKRAALKAIEKKHLDSQFRNILATYF